MSEALPPFPTVLKAVLFDLDGTLVDTAQEFIPAVQQLRAEHDLPPMDADQISASVSNGANALVRLALNTAVDSPAFAAQRERLLTLYSAQLGTAAALYPGVGELLEALENNGIRWGISTNKPRAYTEPLIQKLNIIPAPGSVICPDDVSNRKPHPESLQKNCAQLGCSVSEAIFIGDHARDVQAGRRAPMYTIAAAYGYIETGDDPARWGANVVAEASTDLRDLIIASD